MDTPEFTNLVAALVLEHKVASVRDVAFVIDCHLPNPSS